MLLVSLHAMFLPKLAITLGDPAGVGPETIVAAWSEPAIHEWCKPFVVGHPEIVRRAVKLLAGQTSVPLEVMEISSPAEAAPARHVIPCFNVSGDDVLDIPLATIDRRAGQAAYDCLVAAARMAIADDIDGLVTAPLHKAALWQAGHHYPGHTELLAELCGVDDFAMMLYLGPDETIRSSGGLGVAHVTLHMALRDVFTNLSPSAILAKTILVDKIMRIMKGTTPRIGVCALNPHGGEEGLFGDEEKRIIAPAVAATKAAGMDVSGPWPTDTLMVNARNGQFDGIVAMYHDQGHIALKLLGMHRAVNITLGLPIVRTSVAHGTAFDLAWQGQAEKSSMIEAIRVAAKLATARREGKLGDWTLVANNER